MHTRPLRDSSNLIKIRGCTINGNKRQIARDCRPSTGPKVFGVYIASSSCSRCQEQILPEHNYCVNKQGRQKGTDKDFFFLKEHTCMHTPLSFLYFVFLSSQICISIGCRFNARKYTFGTLGQMCIKQDSKLQNMFLNNE